MEMSSDIDHVLLTRFNLPSEGVESIIRAKEGWLRDRIALFEHYCLPSVLAQTNQDFHWIIYFDPGSPEWLKQLIQSHANQGAYVPIFRPSVSKAELIADIIQVTGGRGARLITTNLDNDDGLAINFVERLQASGPHEERTAVYLSHGLIKSNSRLYLRTDKHNAFGSVVETWASPSTCWADWHTLLGKSMRVIELYDEPGWLQVVHGANVSNRVRGRLVAPSAYTSLFPGLLDDICTPQLLELATDAIIAQPRRLAKESGRALAKAIAMRLLGKKGIDRVKTFWASRSRHKLQCYKVVRTIQPDA
jgi:Putative rhamnosyl transferase